MRQQFHLLVVAFLIAACAAPQPAVIPSAVPTLAAIVSDTPKLETLVVPSETATTTSTATLQSITPEPSVKFRLSVIVDTTSEPVTREQAEAVVAEASSILVRLTSYGFEFIDFVEDSSGGSVDTMVKNYLSAAEQTPNGVVVFTYGDNDQAKLYGGYARQILGPSGFRNEFNSSWIGDNQVYVAVAHYSHKYAACGYAGNDAIQSAVSSNGECRGEDGVACVMNYGYQMCENALNHIYARTETYFAASTIVHEIMHGFSNRANDDHYATASCKTIMGWGPTHFDLAEGQRYASMCPHVYDLFEESYQP
jgi:hypothetical protein